MTLLVKAHLSTTGPIEKNVFSLAPCPCPPEHANAQMQMGVIGRIMAHFKRAWPLSFASTQQGGGAHS